jgi:hypothetical protein
MVILPSLEIDTADLIADLGVDLEAGTGNEVELEAGTGIEADLEQVETGIEAELEVGTGIEADLEAGTTIEADLEAEIVVPAGTDPGAQTGSIEAAITLTRLMLPRFVKEQTPGMKAAFGTSRASGHPTFWGCRIFRRLQRMESMRQSEALERANTFCESILFLM